MNYSLTKSKIATIQRNHERIKFIIHEKFNKLFLEKSIIIYLRMKITYILFFCLLLFSCTTKQDRNIENLNITTIFVENSKNTPLDLSELSLNTHFVKLETNDSCLIKKIQKIYYINNQIIIGDDYSIYFFGEDGRFKYKVERQGDGPEEYARLSDFDISQDGEIINVLDTRKKQIITYDYNGNFIDKSKIDSWAIGMQQLNDSLLILYCGNQVSSNNNNKLICFNIFKQKITDSFFNISNNKSNYLHVHSSSNFTISNNDLLFYELYNDTIYKIFPTSCKPLYYIDFGKYKIPQSLFEDKHNNIVEFQNKLSKRTAAYGITSLISTSKKLLFKYYHDKRYFFCYDSINKSSIYSYLLLDPSFMGEYIIDGNKYDANFFPGHNYFFTTYDNELFIDNLSQIKDNNLRELASNLHIDDNPIIRISKLDSALSDK